MNMETYEEERIPKARDAPRCAEMRRDAPRSSEVVEPEEGLGPRGGVQMSRDEPR